MQYDCGFTKDNKWFRYRAAAIIVEEGCVLFAGNELDAQQQLYPGRAGLNIS